ncbi:MAG: MATE family efflux transporter [Gammaproteobacteria bacterium]|nr:MATE family efflux transporter [Gammaproteobacteria bacterium]
MKDLTQGSIVRNILTMAAPIAIGMLFQTLYLLVDLYFVASLGDAAIAGVGAAGTLMFVVLALTQVLGVGAVALISQAVGRRDAADANLVFNQSLLLAALCAVVTLAAGYALTERYVASIAADAETRAAGTTFLYWFLPGFALQFALVTMGSALRGTGIVKPTMVVQALTVVLNTLLAPALIVGWGTGLALGVAGAGLASTLSVAVGVAMLTLYFLKLEKYVSFRPALWWPQLATWKRMLDIGLPAGGEFALMFVYMGVVYWVIADFGAAAQAGFGIGSRIMQSIFMPAMAIAFAAGPIAGQNFGAAQPARVRETFSKAVLLNFVVMGLVTLLLQWRPQMLIAFFSPEPAVQEIGADFLRIISWTFLAQGVVFTCSGIFQGLGNTKPSLLSSAVRLATFVPLAVWLAARPGFELEDVWHLSVATVVLQAGVSYVLLQGQFRGRLGGAPPAPGSRTDAAGSLAAAEPGAAEAEGGAGARS